MEITYHIIRSRKRKKTLSMKIVDRGTVVIQAPFHTPERAINAFIENKKAWVQEKVHLFVDLPTGPAARELRTGQQMLFLGVSYPLEIKEANHQTNLFSLQHQQFILNSRMRMHGRAVIRSWYETQARAYLPGRVAHFSAKWEMAVGGVRISNAGSRWGSCSPRNRLSFSWRLMMAPPAVIDYVVVHELAHIREKNHSRFFWAFVAKMMPEYETPRDWLRKNGHRLTI